MLKPIQILFLLILVAAFSHMTPAWGASDQTPETVQDKALQELLFERRWRTGESLKIFWLSPTLLAPNDIAGPAQSVFRQKLLLGVANGFQPEKGPMIFRQIDQPPHITVTKTGERRAALSRDDLTTVENNVLKAGAALWLQKAFAEMAPGAQWFAFDGTGIRPCLSGGFTVHFDDNELEFLTPVAGCTASP